MAMGEKHKTMRIISRIFLLLILIVEYTEATATCPPNLVQLNSVTWTVKARNGSHVDTYSIKLCDAVGGTGCEQSSVCKKNSDGSLVSIGNHVETLNYTVNREAGESRLTLTGASCQASVGEHLTTHIIFKCGKTLGSPDLLSSYACVTYFEWYTDAVCDVVSKDVNEVPCQVYDENGGKRDLSPLIKLTGGYSVNDPEAKRNFFINVCRDIKPDSSTTGCSGAAGCMVTSSVATKAGSVKTPLSRNADGNLVLEYTSESKPEGCPDNLKTTITFVCPKRGGGQDPILLSDLGCHYNVEWHTEYACPVDYLTTDQCKFTSDVHDVDFDLSPLKKIGHENYQVNNSDYTYYLNVCGPLEMACDGTNTDVTPNTAVCQTKGDSVAKVTGASNHQTLRYSDGQLTLTYRGGSLCHNSFHRETIIHFHCNKSAGIGQPVYETESHCTYIFNWDTQYACLDHPLASQCRVDYGSKRFDLSALVRTKGDNWEALNGRHQHGDTDDSMFYINVCNDVLTHDKTANCPVGAACMIDHSGKAVSMGKYIDNPTYDEKSKVIKLHYKDGDTCPDDHNKKLESIITLVCRPGDLEGGPSLIRKSDDGCLFEFDWHTAAACVLGRKVGTGCRVFDDDAGFGFDLSSLTKKGDDAYYKITANGYDYYINVCAQVKGTACDADLHKGAGGCQVEKAGTHIYNIGSANSLLSYYDGMINLTYSDGESYHSGVKRKMEIAFLCDRDANDTRLPEFVVEEGSTYFFKWYTRHACPEDPIECVVTDEENHKQYDLSSLSMSEDQENWSVMDQTDPSAKRKFYINVCRPVNPVTVNGGTLACDSQAAACFTSFKNSQAEAIGVSNVGRPRQPPKIISSGLLLNYTSGAECTDHQGVKTVYSTELNLKCKHGQLASGPRFLEQVNNCKFIFLWETEAACAVDTSESDNLEDCSVKDKNSEYIFNLQPLRKVTGEDYTVQGASGTSYKINICGSVGHDSTDCPINNDSPVAVCQVDQDSKQHHLGSVNKKLEFSDDGQLTLTYSGPRTSGGQKTRVVITFLCRKDIQLGQPRFVRKEADSTFFDFETALACPPEPVDCFVSDEKGNQYDLSPLARVDDVWTVVDTRLDHKDLSYYINVCRPINKVNNGSGAQCPGGPIGGCQLSKDGKAFNTGYIQAAPQAASDGSLSIRYLNGEMCHKGTVHQNHRSTRINFFCSPTEHDPSFEGESQSCEYVFNWRTPSACPLKRVVGKECKVTDPLYNQQFDLTPLQSTSTPYEVKSGKYTFKIDICKKIAAGSAGCSDAGVCQTWQDGTTTQYVNAGKASDKLTYEEGSLSLTYNDGKPCHNNKFNRTTIITFTCDQKKYGTDGLIYLNETSDCTYLFEFPTSKACPPFKIAECSVKDSQGNEYDLSSLTLTNDSYYVQTSQQVGKKFVLNVCSSIVHRPGETCPLNSAGCLIDTKETDPAKKYRNLGGVTENPLSVEGGHLKLVYTDGDICDNGKKSRTIITLTCDQNSLDSRPSFLYSENNCDYHFMWFTKAACAVNDKPAPPAGNCKVKNPETGYEFDLTSLKYDKGYIVNDAHSHEYHINVCGAVQPTDGCGEGDSNHCSGSTGSCQQDKNLNKCFDAGKPNANLKYNEGVLSLNYTDGTVCHHNQLPRNTFISFVCHEGSGNGSPVFVDESDDCSYYISWHTELACETKVSCGVVGNDSLDLSALIKEDGYHLAINTDSSSTDGDAVYYINICRPLNPIPGHLCPPGASACRVKTGENPFSIGHVQQPPFLDNDSGKVTILYTHGSPCPSNKAVNTSTKIEFVCKPGPGKGAPELVKIVDGCQYLFTWETNVVCMETGPQETTDCTFHDETTKRTFNFTSLKQIASSLDDGYKVLADGSTFHINVCGAVIDSQHDECKSAAVCHTNDKGQETSFGSSSKSVFSEEEGHIKLSYTDGATCTSSDSGRASAQIIFECDRSATKDTKPTLVSRSPCDVVFRWPTVLVCQPAIEDCVFQDSGNVYDLRLLSRVTGSWTLTDNNKNKYWLNICQGVHGGPSTDDCPSTAAACRQLADGSVDMLGQVESQNMKMKTDADGQTIVLRYTGGSDACSHNKRRSDNVMATTVINFQCANTVGGPQFVPSKSNDDNCVFEFNWKTSIACKNRRVAIQGKDGKITDPKSQTVIDMTSIFTDKVYDIVEPRDSTSHYHYHLNFKGDLALDWSDVLTSHCKGAAICQTKEEDKSFFRGLARAGDRKMYIEDDVLEIVYVSGDKCGHLADKLVTSQIDVKCGEDPNSQPTFIYESHSCVYVFQWLTPAMCGTPKVIVPSPAANDDGNKPGTHDGDNSPVSGGMTPSTVATIIAVFVGIISICLLLIVFHKQERRTAFRLRMKSIFSSKSSNPHRYEYSKLLSGEDDVIMNNMAAESSESTALVTSYHDDSDDDMLL